MKFLNCIKQLNYLCSAGRPFHTPIIRSVKKYLRASMRLWWGNNLFMWPWVLMFALTEFASVKNSFPAFQWSYLICCLICWDLLFMCDIGWRVSLSHFFQLNSVSDGSVLSPVLVAVDLDDIFYHVMVMCLTWPITQRNCLKCELALSLTISWLESCSPFDGDWVVEIAPHSLFFAAISE